ncbi:ROK family transcriptional regulator [Devosia sp. Root436]|uniref:ROK family transcriptional regulator n=1 Tax=Devosia sp. Root436 TaxID=1736537 RepID=UPI0006F2F8D4|nr:ROK family transcriptional regulator [Devosia sp. Root436]KQX38276.1 ROK family transcriptional regulator [Devosia sp. Root436]
MERDLSKRERSGARGSLAIGSNPERNRLHNRRVVLDVVRSQGHLGRTEIARRAHLTPQAVTNIVDELVAENLLIQLGRLRSGRGQPPIQFAVNPDGPMTAGIEIAADHIGAVLLDLSGRVRAQSVRPVADTSPAGILADLRDAVDALRQSVPGIAVNLLGVGVVMPGPFEIEGMSSVGPATLPGWDGLDARALASEAIGEPVEIENDATAAAVGERLYGAGRDFANFGFVYFGVGLGLGIIQEGRPLRGAFGNAGEIGHFVVTPRNRPALYGPDGALENFASLYALREKLAAAGIAATDVADLQMLHDADNPVLLDWIAEAADYLAPTVAALENLLDPQTIIFGGALPDSVIDAIIASLDPMPVSVATRRVRTAPRVIRGQTGQLTAALGAAALPMLETVTPRLHLAPGLPTTP